MMKHATGGLAAFIALLAVNALLLAAFIWFIVFILRALNVL